MFNEWGSRIKRFSIATIAAIALIVGAWTMPAVAGGEETYQVLINAQASMRTGDYCHAHALVYNGTAPYDFVWESSYLWNGSRYGGYLPEIRSAYLNQSGTHTQSLKVWDSANNYDLDVRTDLYVGLDGDQCSFSP